MDLEKVPRLDLLRDIYCCGLSMKIAPPQKKNEAKNRLIQVITENCKMINSKFFLPHFYIIKPCFHYIEDWWKNLNGHQMKN